MCTVDLALASPSAQYQAAVARYWAAQTRGEEREAFAAMQAYERLIQDTDAPYSFWLGAEAA